MARDDLWTIDELEAAMQAYLAVLASPESQKSFSPVTLHRALIKGPLAARSEGSVGRRMSNISTVLKEVGEPWITRYPASQPNVGSAVKATILGLLAKLRAEAGAPTIYPQKAAQRANALLAAGPVARPSGNATPGQKRGSRTVFVRDPQVVAWVLQEAGGRCEGCGLPAPFLTIWGTPYLEVHHIVRLADGGPDTVDNAAALCPNCHRRLHHSCDATTYAKTIIKKIARLNTY